LERKGMGQPGGHGGTYSRERQRVAALGAPTWRREKNGGVRAWTVHGVMCGQQPKGGGAESHMGEAGEGREGAGRWPGPRGWPHLSVREGERESALTGGSG
jgi:hypothetical protein